MPRESSIVPSRRGHAAAAPSRSNLHIYPSTFTAETRILKITQSLSSNGVFERIFIAAVWESGLPQAEILDDRREVVRLKMPFGRTRGGLIAKVLGYLLWSLAVVRRFRSTALQCVNCHSLSVLPIGVWFKVAKGARLVYDTHELETETGGARGLRRWVAKISERLLIQFADAVVVVSGSIEDWYRKTYGLRQVWLIRNIPPRATRSPARSDRLRKALGIGAEPLVFLYQGVVGEARGVRALLDAFAGVAGDRHLVFLGYGPLEGLIREHAATNPRVHFHPAVPPGEVAEMTSGADVGLSLIENASLSYYYCLPNKLFEYLVAGLPVMVSDLPEMAKIVDQFACGWKVSPDPEAIRRTVLEVDRETIAAAQRGVLRFRETISWEAEEKHLVQLYRQIGLF